MLQEKLKQAIEGLNGVVMIDIDDAIHGCWDKHCPEYWILYELGEVAQKLGIPLFIDKGRGLLGDYGAISKDDLTKNWVHIPRFSYENSADATERTLGIPRNQTSLGFAGTYAESCVRKFLWALCEERVIPDVQIDCRITPLTEKQIAGLFKRGKLIYELTDNRYASLFFDQNVLGPLEAQCEERFGPIMYG